MQLSPCKSTNCSQIDCVLLYCVFAYPASTTKMSHFLDLFVLSVVVVVTPTLAALGREVGRTRRLATEPRRGRWSHRISRRRWRNGEPPPPPPPIGVNPWKCFAHTPTHPTSATKGGGDPWRKVRPTQAALGRGFGRMRRLVTEPPQHTHKHTLGRDPRKKFCRDPGTTTSLGIAIIERMGRSQSVWALFSASWREERTWVEFSKHRFFVFFVVVIVTFIVVEKRCSYSLHFLIIIIYILNMTFTHILCCCDLV